MVRNGFNSRREMQGQLGAGLQTQVFGGPWDTPPRKVRKDTLAMMAMGTMDNARKTLSRNRDPLRQKGPRFGFIERGRATSQLPSTTL